jgi:uncharacterized protein YjiS (DUF1127 family)
MIGNFIAPSKGVQDMRNQCSAARTGASADTAQAWLMDIVRAVLTFRRRVRIVRPDELSEHLLRDIGLSDGSGCPRRRA